MTLSRRHRRQEYNLKKGRNSYIKILIFLLIITGIFLFFKLTTVNWTGQDKVSIAIQNSDGSVTVAVLDPINSEKVDLVIPGDTEVKVARNLGILKIKNIVQLGINEKIGGKLLPETITKSFYFPVRLWSDQKPDSLMFIRSKNSNIPMGDRVAIYLFTKKVKNIDISNIDLGKSQFLIKSKLTDGSLGFTVPEKMSDRLLFYFYDTEFNNVKIYIKDATNSYGVAEKTGEILEVFGGKVINVEKIPESDIGCSVWGTNEVVVKKTATFFDCQIVNSKSDTDLYLELGKSFVTRF